jgi:hypothetical protein
VLVTSRSFEEYVAMFDLDDSTVGGVVVDCCAGGSSFVAELGARGGVGIAIDPVYALGVDGVRRSVESSLTAGTAIVDDHSDRFVWDWYGSREKRDEMRAAAGERMVSDVMRRPYAYVAGGLPRLPLRGLAADLVVCSHLLFTWADRFGIDWHRAALAEMIRVTRREVRIFPLVVQATAAPVPFLDRLIDEIRADGHDADIRDVAYEFQRGAHAMLVVRRGTHR